VLCYSSSGLPATDFEVEVINVWTLHVFLRLASGFLYRFDNHCGMSRKRQRFQYF
jgi:hypothetical protein